MGIDSEIANDKSTLRREWIFLNDPALPVCFVIQKQMSGLAMPCNAGVKTGKTFNGHSYDWEYSVRSVLRTSVGLAAIEIRHLTFDVWGDHVRTLSATEIADKEADSLVVTDGTWKIFTDNEPWHFYASISYVAQIRTSDGKVLKANYDAVVREAQRFSERFTAEQLEPTKSK